MRLSTAMSANARTTAPYSAYRLNDGSAEGYVQAFYVSPTENLAAIVHSDTDPRTRHRSLCCLSAATPVPIHDLLGSTDGYMPH